MPDDKKISDLNELTEAVGSDLLAIVDISELSINVKTKKITRSNFMGSPGSIGNVDSFSGKFSSLQLLIGSTIDEFSTDGALTGDSNTAIPTEKAVKTYVDNAVSGISINKIDRGDSSVEVIDTGVGRVEIKVDATLVGQWDSGGLQLQSGATANEFSTDGTLIGDSDTAIPTEKAIKTYVDGQISGAVSHNSTTGLQGGDSTANDYYHLTKDVHDGLYSGSPIIGLGSSTGTNIEVDYGTHSITVDTNGNKQITVNSNGLALTTGGAVNEISTSTILGSSDTIIVTQKAVKIYIDAGDSAVLSSANIYTDSQIASQDWSRIYEGNSEVRVTDTTTGKVEINIDGALAGQFDTNGLTLASGVAINEFSTDGSLAGNLDTTVPTEKAVKTYVDGITSSGSVSLLTGDTTAFIIFGSPENGTTYKIATELVNNIDDPPSKYMWTIANKTINGFEVRFSAGMDSNNFNLEWFILK